MVPAGTAKKRATAVQQLVTTKTHNAWPWALGVSARILATPAPEMAADGTVTQTTSVGPVTVTLSAELLPPALARLFLLSVLVLWVPLPCVITILVAFSAMTVVASGRTSLVLPMAVSAPTPAQLVLLLVVLSLTFT